MDLKETCVWGVWPGASLQRRSHMEVPLILSRGVLFHTFTSFLGLRSQQSQRGRQLTGSDVQRAERRAKEVWRAPKPFRSWDSEVTRENEKGIWSWLKPSQHCCWGANDNKELAAEITVFAHIRFSPQKNKRGKSDSNMKYQNSGFSHGRIIAGIWVYFLVPVLQEHLVDSLKSNPRLFSCVPSSDTQCWRAEIFCRQQHTALTNFP